MPVPVVRRTLDLGGETGGAGPLLLLDACCVINLFATRRVAEILTDLPYQFVVADVVQGEALLLRSGAGESAEMEPVAWEPIVSTGLVIVLQLTGDEEEATYVELTASLDDGEAATCALALQRGLAVATDDRKARRIMSSRAPQLLLLSTLDLIRAWCSLRDLGAHETAHVLRNVRVGGRFMPPRGNPLRAWWSQFLPPSP